MLIFHDWGPEVSSLICSIYLRKCAVCVLNFVVISFMPSFALSVRCLVCDYMIFFKELYEKKVVIVSVTLALCAGCEFISRIIRNMVLSGYGLWEYKYIYVNVYYGWYCKSEESI